MSEYTTDSSNLQQDAQNNLNPSYIHISVIFPKKDIGYIYHLLNTAGKVIYVGQTKSLYARLGIHVFEKQFSSLRYREVNLEILNEEEAKDIIHFDPILNTSLPGNKYCCNIETYKLHNPVLKGKAIAIRKICKKLTLKNIWKGYYLTTDLELIKNEFLKEICKNG